MEKHTITKWILEFNDSCPWLGLLLIMMLIDVVSGITAAIVERKLSSKVGYKGMMRKAAILLVVGMSAVVERAVLAVFPENARNALPIPFMQMTSAFFLVNEALSVMENAKRSGVPLPAFLSKSLTDTIGRISTIGLDTGKKEEKATLTIQSAKIDATLTHEEKHES
jgi:toxin secretion/phage lysis holin